MLTISQLANYAGVTVRAVRHYHERGLLPEPPRDHSGYRRYDARAVIALVRIRTLTAAGVPLSQLRRLLDADDEEFAAGVAEIDHDLAGRIAQLKRHRRELAHLASPEQLCLPDPAIEVMSLMRDIGLSERTLATYRDGWILLAAVYPEGLSVNVAWTKRWLTDPGYVELLVRCEEAFDWDPDDPRLAELAELGADVVARQGAEAGEELDELERTGGARWQLVAEHSRLSSPAWFRLNELIEARSR